MISHTSYVIRHTYVIILYLHAFRLYDLNGVYDGFPDEKALQVLSVNVLPSYYCTYGMSMRRYVRYVPYVSMMGRYAG